MQQQLSTLLPLILIFIAFYFLIIRPQQRKQKERFQMLNALKKGDKIVTIGGLHGTIVDLTEERATIKANEQIRLVFDRSAINAVVNEQEGEKEEKEKSES